MPRHSQRNGIEMLQNGECSVCQTRSTDAIDACTPYIGCTYSPYIPIYIFAKVIAFRPNRIKSNYTLYSSETLHVSSLNCKSNVCQI